MSALRTTIARLRQPEYTGENRCLPCTVANTIIAGFLAAGVGAAVAAVAPITGAVATAGVVLAVSLASIWLRGYLVPGTPELTQRYFPPWLLRAFGKELIDTPLDSDDGVAASSPTAEGSDQADPEETEQLLRSAGVVRDCPHEDDLCLTDEFREVWWRRIRSFRADEARAAAQLATVLGVDPDRLTFVEGPKFGVEFDGELVGQWESDAAFYADLAAEPTLAEWLPEWDELGDRTRTDLLAGLRAFLASCPSCEAELDQVENVRESCCAGELVSVSVECEACGAQVFAGRYA